MTFQLEEEVFPTNADDLSAKEVDNVASEAGEAKQNGKRKLPEKTADMITEEKKVLLSDFGLMHIVLISLDIVKDWSNK